MNVFLQKKILRIQKKNDQMQETEKLKGTIKMFNGNFGFIKSEIGDVYFHKNSVPHLKNLDIGDFVSFNKEPSKLKKDSIQAKDIVLLKKNIQPFSLTKDTYPENIGEIDWFNNKGFGLITNKFGEYFFHISNIKSKPKSIDKGDVCLFNIIPSKKDKSNNDAVSVIFLKECPITQELANKINAEIIGLGLINDDYKYRYFLKLLKIVKPINNIDFLNSIELNQRYKFSLWLENFIEEIDLNLVVNKMIEVKLNLYDDFYANIFARLKSESIKIEVLNLFIKKIKNIDNENKYEKVKTILGLNEVSEELKKGFLDMTFAKSDSIRKFMFWSEKYVNYLDVEDVTDKMISDNPSSFLNQYQEFFLKICDELNQRKVLTLFSKKLGSIDSVQKYSKVKAILGLNEVKEKIKKEFVELTFSNSDSVRRYLLWSENYVNEIDLEAITDNMILEKVTSYHNPFMNIFSRISNELVQKQLLILFLEKLEIIDSERKYKLVKAILDLKEVHEKSKNDFLDLSYTRSDSARKFLFWHENYVNEIDLEAVTDNMILEKVTSYHNPFKNIFTKICDGLDQIQVLTLFSNKLENIDSDVKYNVVKAILGLTEVQEKSKSEFLNLAYARSDSARKFLFWYENFVNEFNLEAVTDNMISDNSTSYSNTYQKIFEKIFNEFDQTEVLNLFLNKIGYIDSSKKYEKIIIILKLNEISEKVKKEFLDLVFVKSDNVRKFLFWYYGLVHEFDIQFIIKVITDGIFSNISYDTIFSRFPESIDKTGLISKVIRQIGDVDDFSKYNNIKKILDSNMIKEFINKDILEEIFQKSSFVNKLRLSYDFHEYFKYNLQTITHQALNCNERILEISLLFDYIIESKFPVHKITDWLDNVMHELNVSENLSFLYQISKIILLKPLKNKFAGKSLIKLIGVTFPNVISYVNSNLSLFPPEYHTQIRSFYHLVTSNGYYRHYSAWQHTKIYEDRILCIEHILKSESLSNQIILEYYQNSTSADYINEIEILRSFKELHIILTSDNKDELIHQLMSCFIDGFQASIKDFKKSIKEETFINLLKNIHYIDKEFLSKFLENKIIDFDIPLKLKLWVYGIINYFDFNQYCFYYFTLNSIERSIFNKKAKALMGETLKQSMLKQREPWELIYIENETAIKKYSATWRSIWFDDSEIRFCIDTNANFSEPFTWNFSEEKFNFLFDYISGRKLKELTIWTQNNFVYKVEGLDELEELIWKVQIQKEVETGSGLSLRNKLVNKIPINMILRNQCIQLLNQFQLNELEPTRVLEKTINLEKGGITVDISLLYSIPINKNDIAIIWESLEFEKSKATHIFKCFRDEYVEIFSDIEYYLQSRSKVRSSLNSNSIEDVERQKKMKYLCRIDHDNFDFSKWEKSLYEVLPELYLLGKLHTK
jgi:cold shock CspA family protein